ncbi:MAG: hypothetical protein KGH78_01805 [Candidatus Micrarchaeota archaeon]|nr:hypothetical protein [Candidatus Micrarchaeota archaeon]
MGRTKVVHDDATLEIKRARKFFISTTYVSVPIPRIALEQLPFAGVYRALDKDVITLDPTKVGTDRKAVERFAAWVFSEYAVNNIEALSSKPQLFLPKGIGAEDYAILQAGLRKAVALLFENVYVTREISNTYSRALAIIKGLNKLGYDSLFEAQSLRKNIALGANAISHSINYMNDPRMEIGVAAAALSIVNSGTFTSEALRFLIRPANDVINSIAHISCEIDEKIEMQKALMGGRRTDGRI